MVDVHGYVNMPVAQFYREIKLTEWLLHICVGSAHCSSYYDGHMPEPQDVGRAMIRHPRLKP